MAGWITVFKAVPWVDVIAAAPGVARSAKKLLTGIRNRQRGEGGESPPESEEGRLEALETQVLELKQGLDASAEIIKSLTEQHARLVEVVGVLRARTRALLVVCAVLVVFSIVLAVGVWG
jgi:hypothetical protein